MAVYWQAKQGNYAMLTDSLTLKTFQYKLRLNKKFLAAAQAELEHNRQLYNAALQERIACYKLTGKGLNFIEQSKHLTDARSLPEVKAHLRSIQQNTLKRLDLAYSAFFRRVKNGEAQAGFPRFKGRNRFHSFAQSLEAVRGCPLKGDKLTVPGVGSCRVRLSRPLEGKVKQLMITRRADGWYALLVCEVAKPEPLPKTGNTVGIDVGLENFATLSTGEVVENPRYFRKAEQALKAQQRLVSRKKRGSTNRKKAVALLGKKHLKVKHQRTDFFHQTSNAIVKEFDAIAVEDLNIKGMVKNHHLAKSISDASWGNFINILSFKAEKAGRRFVKVAAAYTSQDCFQCGNRVKKGLGEREHRCLECDFEVHRDHNSALLIDRVGQTRISTPVESQGAQRSRNVKVKRKPKGLIPADSL
jgi:putative transposase